MLQPLNFFAPYEDLAAHHENQLTRALLVVLRYSPMAHAAWLDLVEPKLRLQQLPAATFRTQQARASSKPRNEQEATVRGISVHLAPDAGQLAGTVLPSSRLQILDAIIEYGDDLVVVVENKIAFGVQTDQPTSINTHGANIEFDSRPRNVSWQLLLEAFADIAARALVSGAEMKLLEDFLEFVEHFFRQVGPYSTLRRAAKSPDRISRRLDVVLASAIGVADRPGQGICWRDLPLRQDGQQQAVEMVELALDPQKDHVVLHMYPGDTLTQARVLYKRPQAVRGLLGLKGWSTATNFHWGFMSGGYCWTPGNLGVGHYIEEWIDRIESTSFIPRAQWEASWTQLEKAGIVRADDKLEFDRRFTVTKIQKATPRPGLVCERAWSMNEALTLDDGDRFVTVVREEVVKFLEQLEEHDLAQQLSALGAKASPGQ